MFLTLAPSFSFPRRGARTRNLGSSLRENLRVRHYALSAMTESLKVEVIAAVAIHAGLVEF